MSVEPAGLATMRAWVLEFPAQIRGSLEEARRTRWPERLLAGSPFASRNPRSVCLCGMGGSGMASSLARAVLSDGMRSPCVVSQDPALPSWVSGDDLVGVTSYSGNTWESRSMLADALVRAGAVFVIASGGELPRTRGVPASSVFTVPSGYAPRAALGWMLPPVVLALAAAQGADAVPAAFAQLEGAVRVLEEEARLWRGGGSFPGRDPLSLARACRDRLVFIYAAGERMRPAAIRFENQLEENAKQMAIEGFLPEIAHNEIMGWEHAARAQAPVFLCLRDDPSSPLENASAAAAEAELARSGMSLTGVPARGETAAARLLSHVFLADRVSVELAALRGIDPLPVAAIDRFKASFRKERTA